MSHDKMTNPHSETIKRFFFLIFLASRGRPSWVSEVPRVRCLSFGALRSKSVGYWPRAWAPLLTGELSTVFSKSIPRSSL